MNEISSQSPPAGPSRPIWGEQTLGKRPAVLGFLGPPASLQEMQSQAKTFKRAGVFEDISSIFVKKMCFYIPCSHLQVGAKSWGHRDIKDGNMRL